MRKGRLLCIGMLIFSMLMTTISPAIPAVTVYAAEGETQTAEDEMQTAEGETQSAEDEMQTAEGETQSAEEETYGGYETVEELVNIAIADDVTVTTQDGHSSKDNINNDSIETSGNNAAKIYDCCMYGSSVYGNGKPYKTIEPLPEAPKNVPWVELDLQENKSRIQRIEVYATPKENQNDDFKYQCTVYGRTADSSAWDTLGTQELKRGDTQENSQYTLDFTDDLKTYRYIMVTLDIPSKTDENGNVTVADGWTDCWPILSEIEIYQIQEKAVPVEMTPVNIATDESVTIDTGGGDENRYQYINDGLDKDNDPNFHKDRSTQLYGDSISAYKNAHATEIKEKQLPWITLSFGEAKSNIKKIVVKALPADDANSIINYTANIYGRNGKDSEWVPLETSIALNRAVAQSDSIHTLLLETPQTFTDILVNLDGDAWPILNEIEIYQLQKIEIDDSKYHLVNLAAETGVTVDTQDDHTSVSNINNHIRGSEEVFLYYGTITTDKWGHVGYKTKYPDEAAPKNVPWIEFDLGEAKEDIAQIIVDAATEGSGYYKYQCTVYGKSGADEAWDTEKHLLGTSELKRSTTQEASRYSLDLSDAPQTLRYVLVTLDVPSEWGSDADCMPVLSEIGIYQRQLIERDEEAVTAKGVYLSDLSYEADSYSTGGGILTDTNYDGSLISVIHDGETRCFKKGLAAHANSSVTYLIQAYSDEYTRFVAKVGVDASRNGAGSVSFKILASNDQENWVTLQELSEITSADPAYVVDVSVKDYRYLKLEANAGTNNSSDHAVYADARLVKEGYEVDSQEDLGALVDIKKVSEYDQILAASDYAVNYTEQFRTILEREFVNRFGYWTIQTLASDSESMKEMLTWLLDKNSDTLQLLIETGDIDRPALLLECLARLYASYKNILSNDSAADGYVYKKMLLALAVTYASDQIASPLDSVKFWSKVYASYDIVERFAILRSMYDETSVYQGEQGNAVQLGESGILTRAVQQKDCSYTIDLSENPQSLRSVLVTLDIPEGGTDCWPILNEIEIYQRQTVTTDEGTTNESVNIAHQDYNPTVTIANKNTDTNTGPNQANINNGEYEPDGNTVVRVYAGSVTGFSGSKAPKDQPWVEFDFGEIKDNIEKIVVHTAPHSTGQYKYVCTAYGKTVEDEWSVGTPAAALANKEQFKTYNMELLRLVMNNYLPNDEYNWLIGYSHTKYSDLSSRLNYWNYMKYVSADYSKTNSPEFYEASNYETYNTKYMLDDYNIPYGDDTIRTWMAMEKGGICWNLSRLGQTLQKIHGTPSVGVFQPQHEAFFVYYEDAQGNGKWDMWYNMGRWANSYTNWGGVEPYRYLLDWGTGTDYVTNNVSNASYLLLAQGALNQYESWQKSFYYNLLADSYADPAVKRKVYEASLEALDLNLDTYLDLITLYKETEASAEEWYALAEKITTAYTYYPVPMSDLLKEIKNYLTEDQKVFLDDKEIVALNKAKEATDSEYLQSALCREIATDLLGSEEMSAVTFSFDGENAGCIVLSDKYDLATDLHIRYNLDGKADTDQWKETTDHVIRLSEEELASISAEHDIRVMFVGASTIYTIDILEGESPSAVVTAADEENTIVGKLEHLEYSTDNSTTWADYTKDIKFTGDRTVTVRYKAHDTYLVSKMAELSFTEDTDTEAYRYVSVEEISLVSAASSQPGQNAEYMLDADPLTIWHTTYGQNASSKEFVIRFAETKHLAGLKYEPSGSVNGRIKQAQIFVSPDGVTWTWAGASGEWANDEAAKEIKLEASAVTNYVKLVVGDVYHQGDDSTFYISGRNFNFYEDATKELCSAGHTDENTDLVCDRCGLSFASTKGAVLEGCSVTMKEDIGVNYQVSMIDEILEKANQGLVTMHFILPDADHTELEVPFDASKVNDEGKYVFSCGVSAKEMSGDIQASIVVDGVHGAAKTYSVRQYAEKIIANAEKAYSEEAVAAAKAMLNYGAYAQVYFEYMTDQPANAVLTEEEKTTINAVTDETEDIAAATASYADRLEGMDYYGSSTLLKDQLVIRHYFTLSDKGAIEQYTFRCGEEQLTPIGKDGYYYVDIPGISPNNFADSYTVTVTEGDSTQSLRVNYSIYGYVKYILKGNYSTSMKNVCRALYLYGEAAKAYAQNSGSNN